MSREWDPGFRTRPESWDFRGMDSRNRRVGTPLMLADTALFGRQFAKESPGTQEAGRVRTQAFDNLGGGKNLRQQPDTLAGIHVGDSEVPVGPGRDELLTGLGSVGQGLLSIRPALPEVIPEHALGVASRPGIAEGPIEDAGDHRVRVAGAEKRAECGIGSQ